MLLRICSIAGETIKNRMYTREKCVNNFLCWEYLRFRFTLPHPSWVLPTFYAYSKAMDEYG